MVQKTTITKISPNFSERGIQDRDAQPPKQAADQLWFNNTTGKLSYYDTTVRELFTAYVDGAPNTSVVYVSGTSIDWSLGSVFKKEVSGAITFTFSNAVDGMIKSFIVLGSASASATLTWPVGTKMAEGETGSIAQGAGVIFQVSNVNGTNYVKKIFTAADANAWPIGLHGDLTINNGQTVTIAAGSIRDYNNLTINAGGTLSIIGNSLAITQIGVRYNMIINGVINNNGYYGVNSSYTVVTPSGETLSHSMVQAASGYGGGGNAPGARGGGAGINGYGGGGGGAGGPGRGGYGAWGGSNNGGGGVSPYGGQGGAGNYTLGNGAGGYTTHGGNGGGSGGAGSNYGGGGGGGGYKGAHARGLYIFCTGVISGIGQIRCNGGAGFNGGAGGPYAQGHGAGGGGGGGAGGAGGNLWVRKPAASPFTVPYTVAGGNGGVGGWSQAGYGQNAAGGVSGSFSVANNG